MFNLFLVDLPANVPDSGTAISLLWIALGGLVFFRAKLK